MKPSFTYWLTVAILLSLTVLTIRSFVSTTAVAQTSKVQIPAEADWTDRGVVFAAGPAGSWDVRFDGQSSPCATVKKDGVYYLYYIGADGNRADDGGPRHRALGVAKSTDGINFTKYAGNPVITYLPTGDEEEGVFMCGATLDSNGEIVLYYGAMTSFEPSQVNDDARLAVSSDGVNFTDLGIVIDHDDSSVWGWHDELDPLGTFYAGGSWYIYYSVGAGLDFSGNSLTFALGLASGPSRDNMIDTGPVIASGDTVFGGTDPIWVSPDKLALFIIRRDSSSNFYMEVRTAFISSPDQLSPPLEVYNLDLGDVGATVYLDLDSRTWFMYHQTAQGDIRVRTAPLVGGVRANSTPPSSPASLTATGVSNTQIDLAWTAANDAERGVVSYSIYRDGVRVGNTGQLSFSDTGLTEGTSYTYEVSAIKGASLEGPRSGPVAQSTLADTKAPTVVGVSASGDGGSVTVVFGEPVDQVSANRVTNYSIDKGILISAASLDTDLKTVTLTTSNHTEGVVYALTVNNVLKRATTPNPISPNTQVSYTYSAQVVVIALEVANGSAYQVVDAGLTDGARVYIDRPYTFSSLPGALTDAAYIETANDDKAETQEAFLTFSVNLNVTAYVAYDARATSLPDWLAGWTDTTRILGTTDVDLHLYSRGYLAGSITLGGNLAAGAAGAKSNYSVIVVGGGDRVIRYPTLAGMNSRVQDLDGDELPEDLNGNDTLDFADIVALFNHLESVEVQNSPGAFDFNGSGSVDSADVMALFDLLVN